ncbi:hypothetical protein SLEP1_g50477 [Rubroshorea leprosula]|uniref:Uncharacterized protein n=1 Tax=Rubroshorea leprosula TaxID=152421 RepID=A0AAV5M040_9ROSI|nr:hypothetical protein SLEP1_g50477 [Rubroshorea leprosula]
MRSPRVLLILLLPCTEQEPQPSTQHPPSRNEKFRICSALLLLFLSTALHCVGVNSSNFWIPLNFPALPAGSPPNLPAPALLAELLNSLELAAMMLFMKIPCLSLCFCKRQMIYIQAMFSHFVSVGLGNQIGEIWL